MSVFFTDRDVGDVTIVTAEGCLMEGDGQGTVLSHFDELHARGRKKCLVDLRGIRHVDRCGWDEFCKVFSPSRMVLCTLKLLGLSPQLESLFQTTRIIEKFEKFDEEVEAVRSFD
jgi:anti-anti-sigma regulatory factor